MEIKIEKLENYQVKLEIEVEAEKFEDSLRKSYYKNSSKFNIPGFRRGKAPQAMIERYCGSDVFFEDAFNMLIPKVYYDAIKKEEINTVSAPEFKIIKAEKGSNLVFSAVVTECPEVELGTYLGIEIEKNVPIITDEDVQKEIEKEADTNSRTIPVEDRPAQKGDTVNIDFEGFIDGEPFEGGEAEDYDLVLGSEQFIPGFEEQIEGMEAGQETDVNVTFPEEYHAADLASKPVVFKVKLNEIRVKEIPEINDEFAKDVSEFDNLEDYKKDIRSKLEETANAHAKNQLENDVIATVVDNAKVEIPDVMVQNDIDRMIEQTENSLRAYNISMNDYLMNMGTTLQEYRNRQKDTTEGRIRMQLVLEKIAEVENINVSDDEISAEIKNSAEKANVPEKDFIKRISQEYKDSIKYRLEMEKVTKLLVDSAKIVEKAEAGTSELKNEDDVDESAQDAEKQ